MRRRAEIAIAAVALAVLWGGLAYDISRPADFRSYHRMLLQVAATAHDATQTGRLVAEQELAGHVTSLYARGTFDEAAQALAGAQQKFAGEAPPDDRGAALRDELGPLLEDAVTTLGDAARAEDDTTRRDGVRRLTVLAGKLEDFAS